MGEYVFLFSEKDTCKDKLGWTAFHWACVSGKKNIVEIMMKDKYLKNLKFNQILDDEGRNGFELAEHFGKTYAINDSGTVSMSSKGAMDSKHFDILLRKDPGQALE